MALIGILATSMFAPRGSTIVLTYHDVITKRDTNSVWFDCTRAELKSQLDWLTAKKARFLSLPEFAKGFKENTLPPNSVLITFADNYAGFYKHALPELRRRKIPSVMFVHTGYVGSSVGRPKMTWEQLRECERSGVVVASQTVSHPADITKLSNAAIRKEYFMSREALQTHTSGRGAMVLAYPNGKYDLRVSRLAQQAGFQLAFTEAQRPVQFAPDPWRIPRYVHTRMKQAWADAQKVGSR
jgi:peptidoglycan/xylan/chitin deacetylase (PgdA/CDA1 family)